MARNSAKNSCLDIVVGVLPTQKVSRCSGCPILRCHRRCRNRCDSVGRRRGRWTHCRGRRTQRRGRWTYRRSQDSVDHLSRLGNLTRSWSWTRLWSCTRSFKTRTTWLRLNQSEARVVGTDNVDGRAVVERVVGGEMVDDDQSGYSETIRLINKTRTILLRLKQSEARAVVAGRAIVDRVVGGEVVDKGRSGLPEHEALHH